MSEGIKPPENAADVRENLSQPYGADYYEHGLGSPYRWDNPAWTEFFGKIADYIVSVYAPRTVLDAGCGIGFLVDALRARGVDARGFDISGYAISQVPERLRPYCDVGSITDEISDIYDLITCIEVLEHLPPEDTDRAIDNLAAHTSRILFSSSPDDVEEPTHVNVRPIDGWVSAFAARGFLPVAKPGADVVAPQTIMFERREAEAAEIASQYELLRWSLQKELEHARRDLGRAQEAGVAAVAETEGLRSLVDDERATTDALRADLKAEIAAADVRRAELDAAEAQLAEWHRWQARSGWRLFVALAGARRRLGPPGTLRDAALRRSLRVAARSVDELHVRLLRESVEHERAARDRRLGQVWHARRSHLRHGGILVRRTQEVLDAEGPIEVVRRARGWLREYPISSPAVAPTRALVTQGVQTARIEQRYELWRRLRDPTDRDLARQREHATRFEYRPLVSVVIPVYNPPAEVLDQAIASALAQTYDCVEVCVANAGDDPACAQLLERLAGEDDRIRLVELSENLGISGNSNAALSLAQGEFVALLDHDDLLAPQALYAIVEALNDDPALDVLYTDEDRIAPGGLRILPYLKPHWSPEFLHNYMWVGHLSVYRRSLVESLGGFRSEYDGSQDYDLMLRAAAATERFRHVPQVLYHWRMIEGSAAAGGKSDARRTNLAALGDVVAAAGRKARIAEYPFANRVVFDLVERPLVSIIIPTDEVENARASVKGILARTTYENFEIIVVSNSRVLRELEREFDLNGVRTVRFDGRFNFSLKCNLGAEVAAGDFLLFLNDDVEPIAEGWIESMLQYGQLPEVGGVSGKLLYADDTIQYAGLVTGVPDIVGTAFHTWPRWDGSYHSMAITVRNVSCLTGACMLLRTSNFWRVGGWDAVNTPISHSDFDLSYRLSEAGLRLVYTPFAELRHLGHVSRREAIPDEHSEETRADRGADVYLLHRWGKLVEEDPFYTRGMRELLYEDQADYQVIAPRPRELETGWWEQPRVLLAGHELSLTGAPGMLLEVANALQRSGMFVVMTAPKGGPLVDRCVENGIPVILDDRLANEPDRLQRFLRGFDIVGANTVLSWRVVRSAALAKKPVVWLVQEPAFGLREIELAGSAARDAFKDATRIVFPSRSTAELYARFGGADNHHAIHYGIADVAREAISPSPFEQNGFFTIAHVGSLEPRKGADVLIDAVKRLPEELNRQVRIVFVGRPLIDDYVTSIRENARGTHADFPGEVPRDVGLSYVRHADLFVCTSRDESGPVVVLEALALGKAVITTAVGAAAEVIRSGVDGTIIPVDDAAALAREIERLMRDPELRRRFEIEARATYERYLTEDRYGEEITAIFRAALRQSDAYWVDRAQTGVAERTRSL